MRWTITLCVLAIGISTALGMGERPPLPPCLWGANQFPDQTFNLNDKICQFCNGGHWENKKCSDCNNASPQKRKVGRGELDCSDMQNPNSGLAFGNGAWKIYDGNYYNCGNGTWLRQDPLPQSICNTKQTTKPK